MVSVASVRLHGKKRIRNKEKRAATTAAPAPVVAATTENTQHTRKTHRELNWCMWSKLHTSMTVMTPTQAVSAPAPAAISTATETVDQKRKRANETATTNVNNTNFAHWHTNCSFLFVTFFRCGFCCCWTGWYTICLDSYTVIVMYMCTCTGVYKYVCTILWYFTFKAYVACVRACRIIKV